MNSRQIENSYFYDKVALRLKHLPEKEKISVLDCFSGKNRIWNKIKERSDKRIDVLRIEKKQKKDVYLKGDNLKYLLLLDLRQFDIICLDSYGVPFKQLEIIFKRKYEGIIFITFIQIQNNYGTINIGLLESLGYTKTMVRKCKMLFNKNGFEKFKQYLANNGIKKITHRSTESKHYIYLTTINGG